MTEVEARNVEMIFSTSVDKLQPVLDSATIREIGLAWNESMARMLDVGVLKYPRSELYRHELIDKEMMKRGFENFGGCLQSEELRPWKSWKSEVDGFEV